MVTDTKYELMAKRTELVLARLDLVMRRVEALNVRVARLEDQKRGAPPDLATLHGPELLEAMLRTRIEAAAVANPDAGEALPLLDALLAEIRSPGASPAAETPSGGSQVPPDLSGAPGASSEAANGH